MTKLVGPLLFTLLRFTRETISHMGYRVKSFTTSQLVNTYLEARDERQVLRLEANIRRNDLIIVDEFGYPPSPNSWSELT